MSATPSTPNSQPAQPRKKSTRAKKNRRSLTSSTKQDQTSEKVQEQPVPPELQDKVDNLQYLVPDSSTSAVDKVLKAAEPHAG